MPDPMIFLIETFVKLNGQKRNLNGFFHLFFLFAYMTTNIKRQTHEKSRSNGVCGVTEINSFRLFQFYFSFIQQIYHTKMCI